MQVMQAHKPIPKHGKRGSQYSHLRLVATRLMEARIMGMRCSKGRSKGRSNHVSRILFTSISKDLPKSKKYSHGILCTFATFENRVIRQM